MIKKWYARNFEVIGLAKAYEWELVFVRNLYGDEINAINCRSLWADQYGRLYIVQLPRRTFKDIIESVDQIDKSLAIWKVLFVLIIIYLIIRLL